MNEPSAPIVKPDFAIIEEIFEEVGGGNLRIPRFQRPFFWKPDTMRELFDSIQKGYPVGSLLLWNTVEAFESFEKVGPLEVPSVSSGSVSYVLDGHQRLSTLYGVLRLPQEFPKGPEQSDWRWWIWYDLMSDSFVHHRAGDAPAYLFPLRALLRTVDFLKAARILQEQLPKESPALIDKAERLAQKIKSYKLALIRIQGGSLEQAVEIFFRVNKRGEEMTPDQMVSALTYREGQNSFDLARRIDEIISNLTEYHFDEMSRVIVFRAIVAAAEEDILRTNWTQLAKKLGKKLPETVDVAEASMMRAAKFLVEELRVPGSRLLPYALQFVMLSEFFRQEPECTPQQIALIRRWFWSSSFSGWFAGANSTNIRLALGEFRQLGRGFLNAFKTIRLDDVARPYPGNFDLRSARVRALLLTQIQRMTPLGVDGNELDIASLLAEYDSHVFQYVSRNPADHVSNPANRILLPLVKGRAVRAQLLNISPSLRSRVLDSHSISVDAYECLERGDVRGFVESRAVYLAYLERGFMTELKITLPQSDSGEADIDTDGGEWR
ncbi:DUF262 domain-containing protein [Corallococcus llansteffanensis]|uniref:DUF262 domain-containing protein n=1 Tax=Corallococcus llansteffanensis TaxID=2316731 RepID=A0A3A8PLL0_9BACT|nr:DUF262 domain-containing protein [Corallococcus llansteffanensis]RKH52494.1 DUF262 domain-containing protein [Corallococcus llansteffanensis]